MTWAMIFSLYTGVVAIGVNKDFRRYIHCLDRTPDSTFLGTGLFLPRWRTGKPARRRYLFYNHFISILIISQYQRPDLRTLYAFPQLRLVSLSPKTY